MTNPGKKLNGKSNSNKKKTWLSEFRSSAEGEQMEKNNNKMIIVY